MSDSGRLGHPHRRWRISAKKHAIETVRNDINVTPLVDVMLVLLIIFMLMTLVMGRGHDVKLPTAKNYSEEKDKNQPVIGISCSDNSCSDATLYVEKNKLGPSGALATLKEMDSQIEKGLKNPITMAALDGERRVFLKAEDRVTYDRIYPVLEYLNREMGLSRIDIAIARGKDK